MEVGRETGGGRGGWFCILLLLLALRCGRWNPRAFRPRKPGKNECRSPSDNTPPPHRPIMLRSGHKKTPSRPTPGGGIVAQSAELLRSGSIGGSVRFPPCQIGVVVCPLEELSVGKMPIHVAPQAGRNANPLPGTEVCHHGEPARRLANGPNDFRSIRENPETLRLIVVRVQGMMRRECSPFIDSRGKLNPPSHCRTP